VYFWFLREWHLQWGATPQEARGEVAGDDLMPEPDIVATRAVEIDAPPPAIWPWLVQMGPGRGGAYTYDWIERRLGIDIHNSDRISPEFPHLKVGDEIPMPGYAMRVERLDPGRAMGLQVQQPRLGMVVRAAAHQRPHQADQPQPLRHLRLAMERQARLPGHRARLVGHGTQDAPHHQAAGRTPRPDADANRMKAERKPAPIVT
jgi:hypothetical protein